METSLFVKWVEKYFKGVTVQVVEKLNDTKNPLTYLHRRMLKKEFSVTGKWESISAFNTLIMADVVSMASELPLKKRDSIRKADGDIPKQGMKLYLNEKQLTELDTLVAIGGSDSQILAKLFQDSPKVIGGIYERNEAMFLEALSTGVTVVEDIENVGIGVRVDFAYSVANKFGVSVLWSNPTTAKPWDDIDRMIEKAKADGNTITKIMLDKTAFNNLARTTQTKELYAFFSGFVGTNIPVPSLAKINAMASEDRGIAFEIVDRTVRSEKNGAQTASKPWADGAVVGLVSDQVGSLVWAKLAEQNHPAKQVSYSTVDEFILVSKYHKNDPIREFTSSQARVVPVLSNVDQIYLMDSKTVQA